MPVTNFVSQNYKVPNYYPSFVCKGSDCRTNCCEGWDITFSIEDYYQLIGLECDKELRRILDRAFYVKDYPTNESYACFKRSWEGGCTLQNNEGLCLLQKSCGEEVLPKICRYYPRSPQQNGIYNSCACSNGCEKTLEMLCADNTPMSFTCIDLSFSMKVKELKYQNLPAECYEKIRDFIINIIGNRSTSLPNRIFTIFKSINKLDKAIINGDVFEIEKIVNTKYHFDETIQYRKEISRVPEIITTLIRYFEKSSPNLIKYGQIADNVFNEFNYYNILNVFDEKIHDNKIMFEKMFINHIFYSGFPFCDNRISVFDAYLAFCAAYSIIRYVTAGYMYQRNNLSDFVDSAAAVFRLIENSSFYIKAAHIMKNAGYSDVNSIHSLLFDYEPMNIPPFNEAV